MNSVPLPVRKLCLTLAFDLSSVDNASSLPSKDHDDAVQKAAKTSGLFAPESVVGRSITAAPGDLTIEAAQDVEFDALAASGEFQKPACAFKEHCKLQLAAGSLFLFYNGTFR
jgi:hypothetical protein